MFNLILSDSKNKNLSTLSNINSLFFDKIGSYRFITGTNSFALYSGFPFPFQPVAYLNIVCINFLQCFNRKKGGETDRKLNSRAMLDFYKLIVYQKAKAFCILTSCSQTDR